MTNIKKIISVVLILVMIGCSQVPSQDYTAYLETVKEVHRTGPAVLVTLPDGTKLYDPRMPDIARPQLKREWYDWGIPLITTVLTMASQAYMAKIQGETSQAWTRAFTAGLSSASGYIVNSYNQTSGESTSSTGTTSISSNDGYSVPGTFTLGNQNQVAGSDIVGGDYATEVLNTTDDHTINNPPTVVTNTNTVPLIVRPEIITNTTTVPLIVRPEVVNPVVVRPEIITIP